MTAITLSNTIQPTSSVTAALNKSAHEVSEPLHTPLDDVVSPGRNNLLTAETYLNQGNMQRLCSSSIRSEGITEQGGQEYLPVKDIAQGAAQQYFMDMSTISWGKLRGYAAKLRPLVENGILTRKEAEKHLQAKGAAKDTAKKYMSPGTNPSPTGEFKKYAKELRPLIENGHLTRKEAEKLLQEKGAAKSTVKRYLTGANAGSRGALKRNAEELKLLVENEFLTHQEAETRLHAEGTSKGRAKQFLLGTNAFSIPHEKFDNFADEPRKRIKKAKTTLEEAEKLPQEEGTTIEVIDKFSKAINQESVSKKRDIRHDVSFLLCV